MEHEQLEELDRLIAEQSKQFREMRTLETQLFKIENYYMELAGETPITRSIEYYLNMRIDKKKPHHDENRRIFATNYPRMRRN